MDARLVAWARAVKARRRGRGPPPLWLFTDPAAMPDLPAAIARLPPGLCGVVLRHDGAPDRAALAAAAARQCRAGRLALSIAGDARLAWRLRAGVHLRRGQALPGTARVRGWISSSAHGAAELSRARRAGAEMAFLSPAFPTGSHPGQPALGCVRWAGLARRFPGPVLALGGVTGWRVGAMGRCAAGAGAIGALV